MKRISEKLFFLFVLLLTAGISVCCIRRTPMTFFEITNDLLPYADVILDKKGDPTDGSVLSAFLDKQYTKYSGKTGSTARRSYSFYDENGNLLFTFTDLGNRNLVRITIGDKTTVYQYK